MKLFTSAARRWLYISGAYSETASWSPASAASISNSQGLATGAGDGSAVLEDASLTLDEGVDETSAPAGDCYVQS